MRISIIGLQFSGKSTFFNLITSHGMEGSASGKKGATIGTCFVPDPRLDKLSEVYQPKKTVRANLEFIDTMPLSSDGQGKSFSGETLDQVKRGDALCLVVREFDSPMAPAPGGTVNGMRDLDYILGEFIMTDLVTLDKRAERLRKQVQSTKKPEELRELEAVEKALAALEEERPVRDLELTEQELKYLSPYQLLTLKPLLVVVNVGEDEIPTMKDRIAAYQERFPQHTITALCANMELELAQMDAEEAEEFMTDLGLEDPAFDRVIASCFEMLGLKVFFTVGEDECRSWPVARDATAYDCAGAIHSDLQRGFIRAVVLPYSEFEANPDPKTFKSEARQEKKDYLVSDGGLIEIRFNV